MNARRNTLCMLPHELLGEVFAHHASICPDAPIVLGAVSRLLRHVVSTTPSVWTHLKLDGADGTGKTKKWFHLSKACHVSVHIDMVQVGRPKQEVESPTTVTVPDALKILRLHTGRVKSLYLRADTQTQACAALAAIYSDIPATTATLGSLRISITNVTKTVSNAPLLLPEFPAIPSITSLEVTNVALAALGNLDLAQLRNIRIVQPLMSTPVEPSEILDLFCHAPGIRRVHIEGRIANAIEKSEVACLMPQLEELNLRTNNIVGLLDQFTVPALRALLLRDLDGKRANASDEMGAALQRLLGRIHSEGGDDENNELRKFELAGVNVDCGTPVWQGCVQKMKALEVFKVDSSHHGNATAVEVSAVVSTPCPEETRPRPFNVGFGFGFGGTEGLSGFH